MKRMLKVAIVCMGVGYIVPTLAFATISEPAAQAASYLFKLTYDDAESAIGFALADKGAGDKIMAQINGRKDEAIFSYDKPIAVEIRGLTFDKNARRWNASLMFVAGEQIVSAIPVAGRFDEALEVPVLKRSYRNGEVISEKDIELKDYPVSATRSDVITDIASLVGKSPLRTVSQQRPIRQQEIVSPAVVKKNSLVQMYYSTPGMKISTSGQALEEGAKGSVINVRNSESKKLIRAMVLDSGSVEVVPQAAQSTQLIKDATHETN